MGLPNIRRSELPKNVRNKLQDSETVHYFAYIASKGGCAEFSSSKQWILVTNRRILFEASVKEGLADTAKFVHQSGSIPMSKVSYVGAAKLQKQEGCSQVNVTYLRINSSGGEIILAVPTLADAERVKEVIDEVLSQDS